MRQEFPHSTIKHGTHPIILLKIFWTGNTVGYYSDAKEYEYFEPKLLAISDVGFTVSTTKTSDSATVSVTLDDTDGSIKSILDQHDIHKSLALVYQGFQDLEFVSLEDSAFLLMRGEISTPIVWRESDRTISFDIVSQVENRQVGFSPGQGFFEGLSDEQLEETWPLGFGEVVYQKCPNVTTRSTGKIATEYENLTMDKLESIDRAYDDYYIAKASLDNINAEQDITKKPELEEYAELVEKFNYASHYLWELVRWTEHVCNLKNSVDWSDYLNVNFNIYQLKLEADTKNRRLAVINRRLDIIVETLAGNIDNNTRSAIEAEQAALLAEKEDITERLTEIAGELQTAVQTRRDKLLLILNFNLSLIRLQEGHSFPTNGQTIFLLINNVKFEGYINGNVDKNLFNVINILPTYTDLPCADLDNTTDPAKYITTFKLGTLQVNLENQYCVITKGSQVFIVHVDRQIGNLCYYSPQIYEKDNVTNYNLTPLIIDSTCQIWQTSPVFLKNWIDYFNLPNIDTVPKLIGLYTGNTRLTPVSFSLKIGDIAYLDSATYSEVFIINCVPRYHAYSDFVPTNDQATQYVEGVYAYKTVNDIKVLQRVDPSLYTLVENSIHNDVVLTYLKMPRLLSQVDKSYDDSIYVSYKSGAAGGSQNTADIIKYLILCFTYNPSGYNVNDTSFLAAAAKLTKYPMNFSIQNRENTLDLVDKLAYQNRCAVYWYNQVAYIVYLPYFQSLTTLTQDYILNNSLEISYESTDEVITEHVAKWTLHPLQEKENKLTLRFNINKLGKVTEETDYFAIKHRETIEKSLTYWAIQKSFSYKILTFQGPLSLLRLMPFDQLTVELEAGLVSNSTTVKGEVISLTYNPNALICTVTIKTNIRAGEMSEYWFRWPYDVVQYWPYQYDIDYVGGNKAGLEGPTYLEEFVFDTSRAKDYGKEVLADSADPILPSLHSNTITPYRPAEPPVAKKNNNLVLHTEKTFITDSTGNIARLDTVFKPVRTYPNTKDYSGYYRTRQDFVALVSDVLLAGRDITGDETLGSRLTLRLCPDMGWESPRMPFIAKITGYTQMEGKLGAYKYSWEEVYVGNAPDNQPNGRTRAGTFENDTYAINACEEPNIDETVRWGNGIQYDANKKVPGTNLTFQPIPINTHVIMVPVMYYVENNKVFRYVFAIPNGTDGTCD